MAKTHQPLGVFSARDLRLRGADLLRQAEEGRLSVITKHSRPAALAIPFDARLVEFGVDRALALSLVETGGASLVQGARIAGLSLEKFIELLGQAGIPAVDYGVAELEQELEALQLAGEVSTAR